MDVEKAKEKFTKDLQRYYFQLTQGCGKPDCKSTRCASNLASPLPPNQAAAEALQLAKEANPFYVCRGEIDALDYKSLESLINECKKEGSFSKLSKKLFAVFSNIENINLSFLKTPMNINDPDTGLDVPSITQAFQLLKSLGPDANNPLSNALESLLANYRRSFSSWTNVQAVRLFIILFESPLLEDASSHERILTPLCSAMLSLSKTLQERLIRYWSTFSHQKFHSLLSLLHQAITFRILLPPFVESVNTDKVIITATKAMSLLYQVNEKAKLLPYTDFHNDLISEKLDIGEDYVNWVQGGNRDENFSFCNYPFVLDSFLKSRILHVESVVQQRRQRMAAFQQMMMGNFELPALAFKVRRDNLIPDSIEALSRYDPDDLKKELRIKFVGEEAVDEGGVKKEWFQLLLRHIFDPKYGMFVHNPQTRMDWFNHHSMDFIEFELIGKLLGLAIYNDVILDLHFPHVLYKKLCGIPVTFEDLKETHPDLAKGFEDLLNYMGDDVEDTFCLTFQISEEVFGEKQFVNLKPNGDKETVTNQNRQEYVNLYMKYLLEDSIQKQFEYFERGFKYLSNTPAFKLFRWEEIELLICGSPELDFDALERNTQYDSGYSKDHPVIKNFWNVVHSLPVDKKKRLLFFATGSDRSPIGGLGNLPFVISRHGEDSDRLPSAHTCFNHLLLPEYSSLDKLRERLLAAIENAEGFGML